VNSNGKCLEPSQDRRPSHTSKRDSPIRVRRKISMSGQCGKHQLVLHLVFMKPLANEHDPRFAAAVRPGRQWLERMKKAQTAVQRHRRFAGIEVQNPFDAQQVIA